MQKLNGSKWSFVTVIGAVLILALCGTTGAVAGSLVTSAKIKNNTIKSKDVRNNALTSADVKTSSLNGSDIADGSLTNQDVGVLFATVNANGTLANSSGGVVSKTLDTGEYEVGFGRDVRNCAFTASPAVPTGFGTADDTLINVADRLAIPSAVYVGTEDSSGAAKNEGFHLIVVC